MTEPPRWWQALPPAETEVACGDGRHVIRWEAGKLTLPAHPDAEAERVLAALGGATAACGELAEIWRRHRDDLDVLALGPRWAADEIGVSWDDVEAARSRASGPGVLWSRSVPMRQAFPGGPVIASTHATRRHVSSGRGGQAALRQAMDRARGRQVELLSLFALGPAFQFRLSGAVAATWAAAVDAARTDTSALGSADTSAGGRADRAAGSPRPALTAALAGRLAPAAQAWLGIEPGQVTVSLHEGPGWGELELNGSGASRKLRASLPVDWLASVWACGLAVADGHLVVAVLQARWPHARVLALPEPGSTPVVLGVWAGPGPAAAPAGSGEHAHWMVTDAGDTGEEAGRT